MKKPIGGVASTSTTNGFAASVGTPGNLSASVQVARPQRKTTVQLDLERTIAGEPEPIDLSIYAGGPELFPDIEDHPDAEPEDFDAEATPSVELAWQSYVGKRGQRKGQQGWISEDSDRVFWGAMPPEGAGLVASRPMSAEAQHAKLESHHKQLAEEDYKLNGTRAKAFKNWFGDWESDPEDASKIVDLKTGKPLRLFHGTSKYFLKFDPGKVGSGSGSGLADTTTEAYFFTTDTEEASGYSSGITLQDQRERPYPSGAQIVPVYVNARKPLIRYDYGIGFTSGDIKSFIDEAKAGGHDGLVLRRGDDASDFTANYKDDPQQIVVFNPKQIKSTFNMGTFDQSDNDITLSWQSHIGKRGARKGQQGWIDEDTDRVVWGERPPDRGSLFDEPPEETVLPGTQAQLVDEEGKPESIQESFHQAFLKTAAHEDEYQAKGDSLPVGTVIISGQRRFTKEVIDGYTFWKYESTRGNYKGHLSSRQMMMNAGSKAVDDAVAKSKPPNLEELQRQVAAEQSAGPAAPAPIQPATSAAAEPQKPESEFKATMYTGSGREDPGSVYLLGPGPVFGNDTKYYAASEEEAKRYGSTITRHDVVLRKPAQVKNDVEWHDLTKAAGVKHDLGLATHNKDFMRSQGETLKQYLKSKGHDGIVVKVPISARSLHKVFGHDQVVAFGDTAMSAASAAPAVPPFAASSSSLVPLRPVASRHDIYQGDYLLANGREYQYAHPNLDNPSKIQAWPITDSGRGPAETLDLSTVKAHKATGFHTGQPTPNEVQQLLTAAAKAPGSHNNLIKLADLRAALPHWSWRKFNDVVKQARVDRVASLSALEGRGGINPEDEKASIREGSASGTQPLGFLSLAGTHFALPTDLATSPWVEYVGPHGGHGWQNSITQRIVYGGNRPGRREKGHATHEEALAHFQKREEETAVGRKQASEEYKTHGTKAKAFKSWFGDWEHGAEDASKVVNPETGEPQQTHPVDQSKVMKDGVPVTVYHGTPWDSFDEFKKDALANGNNLLYGPGFYFTDTEAVAKDYRERGSGLVAKANAVFTVPFERYEKEMIPAVTERREALLDEKYKLNAQHSAARIGSDEKKQIYNQILENSRQLSAIPYPASPHNSESEVAKWINNYQEGLDNIFGDRFKNWVKVPQGHVFKVYLNIRKPFDVDKGKILADNLPGSVQGKLPAPTKTAFVNGKDPIQLTDDEWDRVHQMVNHIYPYDSRTKTLNATKALYGNKNYAGWHNIEWHKDTAAKFGIEVRGEENPWEFSYKELVKVGMKKTAVNKHLAKLGHDGITHTGHFGARGGSLVQGVDKHRVWIAFEPNQIKSADNIGTFDPNESRIDLGL